MKNLVIVSTTINPPTKATKKFCELGIPFIIAGDLKTPHDEYRKLPNVIYLDPEYQEKNYKELSDAIGWNKIQRRNLAFVEAYKLGYEVIATIDDDNIPYDDWGKNIMINKTVEVDLYSTNQVCFDPLSVTNYNHLWHRGYPIEDVPYRKSEYLGKKKITPFIQADLWDGDPDIDSICRLTYKPICKFDVKIPYTSNKWMPFNSQNTFLHRSVLPYYMMLPFVGRMDDIWAAYILEHEFPCDIVFNKATVYQERNNQCLIKNLENECLGYRNTKKMLSDMSKYESFLSKETLNSFNIYKKLMKSL